MPTPDPQQGQPSQIGKPHPGVGPGDTIEYPIRQRPEDLGGKEVRRVEWHIQQDVKRPGQHGKGDVLAPQSDKGDGRT